MFRIAFALGLSVEELQEYLRYGISEPGIQVNDYAEFIAMYCLDHACSYEECCDMTAFFEERVDMDIQVEQTAHTDRILYAYEELRGKPKDEFLLWMCRNTRLFKGYSMVTYRYFVSLMNEVLEFYRAEVKDSLWLALEEAGFFAWAAENEIAPEQYEHEIRRFLKNAQRWKKVPVTPEMVQEIRTLYARVYAPRDRVCDLLAELYSSIDFENCGMDRTLREDLQSEFQKVNAKYVSELLNISLQKERQMRMRWALRKLRQMPEDGDCPDWIAELAAASEGKQCRDVQKYLERSQRNQDQRVKNIQRQDLLILIQYISQRRCLAEQMESGREYDCAQARKTFVDMADTILEACGMRPVDERYRLDYILLQCYGEEEMYLFFEVFEKGG